MLAMEMMAYLLAAASGISGLPPPLVDELPPVVAMAPEALRAQACSMKQEQCRGIVALFDADNGRILVSDALDLADPADNSFLVHELVHVLEYRYRGGRGPEGCRETLRSERFAYRVQNAYLRREGRAERFGSNIMALGCAPDQPGDSTIRLERGFNRVNEEAVLQDFLEERRRGRAAP